MKGETISMNKMDMICIMIAEPVALAATLFCLFYGLKHFFKKDSIVDTISAMEFCFLYGKCPIFALLPLISAVLRAFFRMNTYVFMYKQINPPSSAPWGTEVADFVSFNESIVQGMDLIDKLEFDSYLTALTVYVAPQ